MPTAEADEAAIALKDNEASGVDNIRGQLLKYGGDWQF